MQGHFSRSNHHTFFVLLVVIVGGLFFAVHPGNFIRNVLNEKSVSSLSLLRGTALVSAALPSPTYRPLTPVQQLLGEDVLASLQHSTTQAEGEFFAAITPCIREKLGNDFLALEAGAVAPTTAMRQKASACMNEARVKTAVQKILDEQQEASVLEALKPFMPVFKLITQ